MTPAMAGVIVCPYRFTAHPDEMSEFLDLLGLRELRRQSQFAVFGGRSGRIAVHPLSTAHSIEVASTSLVLMVPGARHAAETLAGAGLDTIWWDESFGQQAAIRGPIGVITLDSESDDDYGYETVSDTTPLPVDVVATVYSADLPEAEAWFDQLGFVAGDDSTRDWRPLRSGRQSGIIGLHSTPPADGRGDAPASIEIGLEVAEPLDALAARLTSAEHPVELVLDNGPEHLLVTDPDGMELEIYRTS